MSKKMNKETLKNLNQTLDKEIKELEELNKIFYDKLKEEKPKELNKKIVEKYEKVLKKILKTCKENQIKKLEEVNEKFPIFKFGLEHFVDSYLNFINLALDERNTETEINILKELIEWFDFEEFEIKEYKIMIIRDLYVINKEKEAEEELEKFLKAYPEEGEGYEIKCEWELEKNNPDMEKIAEILEKADDNGTSVYNKDIYEKVIEYYNDLGNDEIAEYFKSLLDFMNEEMYDMDDDDEYEEMYAKDKKELIEEFEKSADDNIIKGKKFEEYVEEKEGVQLIAFLGTQTVTKNNEELEKILKEPKKYILENYEEILKENIKHMPEYVINLIKETNTSGIIEKDLKEIRLKELEKLYEYFSLKPYGMAFISCKDKKLTIVIPFIKQMKKYIEDKKLMEENKKINEKMNVIVGMCEMHGAIKGEDTYKILEKIYKDSDKQELEKIIMITCGFFGMEGIKVNPEKEKIEFIYNNLIDEEIAKEVIKSNKEIKNYTKEEYLKYSDKKFLYKMKGYKTIEKEVNSGMLFGEKLFRVLGDILIPYTIERRLSSSLADELLEKLLQQLVMMEEMGMGSINKEKVEEGFKQLDDELPRWK